MTRYNKSHLYIIDVSQSVEQDHPRAFDFLRNDIRNVNEFFARRSVGEVNTLGLRRTWEFVVSDRVGCLSQNDEIGIEGDRNLMALARTWIDQDATAYEKKVASTSNTNHKQRQEDLALLTAGDEAVFMSSFIPRSLAEVVDPERM